MTTPRRDGPTRRETRPKAAAPAAAVTTRVALEQGRTWTFACAVDWPGWCRRAKSEALALEALLDYAGRYAPVAGPGFSPGRLRVIGTVQGNATTDFGAPAVPGPWDDEPLTSRERERLIGLLAATWSYLDAVVAAAPAELRKGPRGGGRDRDAVVSHVREAERAYTAKVGARVPPRTPWQDQRARLTEVLVASRSEGAWTPRYTIRRCAWHVLDHAWEIEDKRA